MDIKKLAETIDRIATHAECRLNMHQGSVDLDQIYEFFRVKPANENIRTTKEVLDVVEQRLQRRIKHIDAIELRQVIDELKKYYLYRHIKVGDDVRTIWNYIERFSEYVRPNPEDTRNKGNPISDVTLTKIIILTVWITRLGHNYDRFEHSQRLHPELWRYAYTVLYVEDHVKEALIENGILQNREEVALILFARIESRVLQYGSVRFLDHMLSEYKSTFDAETDLFAPTQKVTRKFLYHLAIKMATTTDAPVGKGYPETIGVIENIASVLLNLYDFRIDNQFQLMFLNEPIPYFQKSVFHDALYKDFQYPPESTLVMLDSILDSYQDKIEAIVGIDKQSFMIISREIIAMAIQYLKSPGALPRLAGDELCKRLRKKVQRDVVIAYLTMLSTTKCLNKEFNHPFAIEGIDDDSEWLIHVPNTEFEYFMPLPSIDCFGLYDKIKELLGHPRSWGEAFERFIQEWMTKQLGEPVHSGKYVFQGQPAESDGVAVVGNHTVVLESKTKPLTRKARSGHIGKLLLDLGGAFIDSQMQAFRTEYVMREGLLELYDQNSNNKEMVQGKCKPIAEITAPDNAVYTRISCTPFHFGVFTENTVCHNVFQALVRYSFGTTDEDLKDQFVKFEKKRQSLLALFEKLKKAYNARPDNELLDMTHRSYFLSFGLLYMLTSPETSSRSASERLLSFGSIQSGDYNSYSILKFILRPQVG
ncbi:hypothetical protein NZD89_02520 [Alicyclobacillus fastidiosus]|uniref:Uncharacterized protein n=1 Tax=Alicyclobacillus fastidiosus TaxID=392011 RepID=A0ABY6ZHR2_9BACL|nr:hypothetical protein [Alicyclobacillus fastidiosus]WAH42399.1 hypothetical protein NZD89_02520 [Alicyclobacillus fastidiosus]